MARTTEEVLRDHLRRRKAADLGGDLCANYHPDVRLLSAEGVHHGHDGVRHLADILRNYVTLRVTAPRRRSRCGRHA